MEVIQSSEDKVMAELNLAQYTDQLIELYSNDISDNLDSFSLGMIREISADYFIFESVSESGTFDALQIRVKQCVAKIETQSAYIDLYQFMININEKANLYDPYKLLTHSPNYGNYLDPLASVLNIAKHEDKLISCVTTDEQDLITGKVIDLSDMSVTMLLFNFETNTLEEQITIPLSNVIQVYAISEQNYFLEAYLDNSTLMG